jgi:ABC-type uncharacterized transport system ATPase subunit
MLGRGDASGGPSQRCREVSFSADAGEAVGIAGISWSGRERVNRALAGEELHDEGA